MASGPLVFKAAFFSELAAPIVVRAFTVASDDLAPVWVLKVMICGRAAYRSVLCRTVETVVVTRLEIDCVV